MPLVGGRGSVRGRGPMGGCGSMRRRRTMGGQRPVGRSVRWRRHDEVCSSTELDVYICCEALEMFKSCGTSGQHGRITGQ